MARIRNVSAHRQMPLSEGWELASVDSGIIDHPDQLTPLELNWRPAKVPGTVAMALGSADAQAASAAQDLDAVDWWYRCRFRAEPARRKQPIILKLDGLATLADVWLNGVAVLCSTNMFLEHAIDVGHLVQEQNELHIRFQSLQSHLKQKRPRPRWFTRLVKHQHLRWFRTTLLGRIPGWSPPIQPVGPWRPITLTEHAGLAVDRLDLRTRVIDRGGIVNVALRITLYDSVAPITATLVVGEQSIELDCEEQADGGIHLRGELGIPDAILWWPHTHGAPALYAAKVVVQLGEAEVEIDCGRLGFRTVEIMAEASDDFGFRINGRPIFCRGACWTPLDIAALSGTPAAYRAALETARNAGLNMLRISGAMVYEQDSFYDLCDELGLLVWQDFMLANMDYPASDAGFLANIKQEAEQLVERLQAHPCLALLCGGSEVEQQAAMLGLPQAFWSNALFQETLPEVCRERRPDVPYWPSSPSGGALPFQANAGVAHYYGVGAFMRPLEDARRSEIRFASECLGFANVPEDPTIDLFIGAEELAVHHPKWKARTPRDTGAGYDFDDVRDHYLQLLFRIDPMMLRYSDLERYLTLSRVTTGEVMAGVFAEWRRQRSTCRGGLVWFYRDLWPGAGWGILDSTGQPKAAYFYLKRVCSPIAIFFTDEGLNGLQLHAVNDTAAPVVAEVQIAVYRQRATLVATTTADLQLPPREGIERQVDALFGSFMDLTYAYRFGPPGHDLVVATLRDKDSQRLIGDAFYFPLGLPAERESDIGLEAVAERQPGEPYTLTVKTKKLALAVAIRAAGFSPRNNYFHIEPGGERSVLLDCAGTDSDLRGAVQPLNGYGPTRISVRP